MSQAAATSVLDHIVEPVVRRLNAGAARALLGIRADKATAKRMAFLARKCDEGELTIQERVEYETNILASEFLALLQARARALLLRETGTNGFSPQACPGTGGVMSPVQSSPREQPERHRPGEPQGGAAVSPAPPKMASALQVARSPAAWPHGVRSSNDLRPGHQPRASCTHAKFPDRGRSVSAVAPNG